MESAEKCRESGAVRSQVRPETTRSPSRIAARRHPPRRISSRTDPIASVCRRSRAAVGPERGGSGRPRRSRGSTAARGNRPTRARATSRTSCSLSATRAISTPAAEAARPRTTRRRSSWRSEPTTAWAPRVGNGGGRMTPMKRTSVRAETSGGLVEAVRGGAFARALELTVARWGESRERAGPCRSRPATGRARSRRRRRWHRAPR